MRRCSLLTTSNSSISCDSRQIATITRVPTSVQRQRRPPHWNSIPIVNSSCFIASQKQAVSQSPQWKGRRRESPCSMAFSLGIAHPPWSPRLHRQQHSFAAGDVIRTSLASQDWRVNSYASAGGHDKGCGPWVSITLCTCFCVTTHLNLRLETRRTFGPSTGPVRLDLVIGSARSIPFPPFAIFAAFARNSPNASTPG